MSTAAQPKAIWLAEQDEKLSGILRQQPTFAPELRRLHAENEQLRSDLESIGAGGVGPLMPGKPADCIPRNFNTWSPNEGDTWYEHPADAQIIEDVFGGDMPVVGDEYEVIGGWCGVKARYRITSVSEDGDCEVECVSHQHAAAPKPPTTEQSSAVEQPQSEQALCCESWSVNHIDDLGKIVDSSGRLIATVYGLQAEKIVACHNSHAKQKPQGEQEPVAVIGDVWTLNFVGGDPIATIVKKHGLKIGDKLYTHPQNLNCKSTQARLATLWGYVKEQPKREPLTDEQIEECFPVQWEGDFYKPWRQAVARAIERTHGIEGQA